MSDSEFFREATLCIHSSLQIETAMDRCLGVLRRFMPASRMGLFLYDDELGALRLIARATDDGGERLDRVVHLSPEANAACRAIHESDMDVDKVGSFQDTVIGRELRGMLHPAVGSYLALQLAVEGKKLAYLAVGAVGEHRFDDHHARLLASLKAPLAITVSNALRHEEVLRLKALLDDDKRYLQEQLLRASGEEVIGEARGLAAVMRLVRQVAASDSPVLILGETGVGKEVVANALHGLSPRRRGPLIKLNCGAIPESLIDSELFGHVRGAFTGAVSDQRGRFERAHGGTLFLDEVAELPLTAQTRLLRVLQDKTIERIGGSDVVHVDVRIITATHRDLGAMVEANEFRRDLWFRLNVFPITIPPLRERTCDIAALVDHFVHKKATELRLDAVPLVAPGAMEVLAGHDWPGNVRELENLVERAMIMDRAGPLRFDHLLSPRGAPSEGWEGPVRLDDAIATHIRRVLRQTDGKVHGPGGAAELMGVHPSTLRARMQKLGIPYRKRERGGG